MSTDQFGTRIIDFRQIHRAKTVFILASGPSLADLDLSPLSRRLTMGLNRSVLLYPETTYQCVMDQRLFDEYEAELKRSRYLFTLEGRPWGVPMKLLGSEGFSWNLNAGVYSGYTIAYVAMQIACFMGFRNIIYLGLDLSHRSGHTHFFGFDFRSKDHESTEFPKMKKMLEYGAEQARSQGIKVYTCSQELAGFERISFEEALAF